MRTNNSSLKFHLVDLAPLIHTVAYSKLRDYHSVFCLTWYFSENLWKCAARHSTCRCISRWHTDNRYVWAEESGDIRVSLTTSGIIWSSFLASRNFINMFMDVIFPSALIINHCSAWWVKRRPFHVCFPQEFNDGLSYSQRTAIPWYIDKAVLILMRMHWVDYHYRIYQQWQMLKEAINLMSMLSQTPVSANNIRCCQNCSSML